MLRRRLLAHLGNFINKRYDAPLYRALEKYGLDSFELKILETVEEVADKIELRKILDVLEVKYIEEYDSYNNGYNQTKGADGGILGYKMTDEQKTIISQSSKKQMTDGRYTVYCKNLETGEIIEDLNMTLLSEKLGFNAAAVRNAKSKNRIYRGKYYFSNTLEELENIQEIKINNSKYNSKGSINYLIEYYNIILQMGTPTISEISQALSISKDTVCKRNAKLKTLGYKLPNSNGKIKGILITNMELNESYEMTVEECAMKFNVKETSIIKQARRNSIYKKNFKLELIYED